MISPLDPPRVVSGQQNEFQVWCLIVSIPDLCPLSYFVKLSLYCPYLTDRCSHGQSHSSTIHAHLSNGARIPIFLCDRSYHKMLMYKIQVEGFPKKLAIFQQLTKMGFRLLNESTEVIRKLFQTKVMIGWVSHFSVLPPLDNKYR